MDFEFSEERYTLSKSVCKMIDRHAAPDYIRRLDREQAYPYELYDARVEMGLPCMPFPEEYCGLAPNRNGSCVFFNCAW